MNRNPNMVCSIRQADTIMFYREAGVDLARVPEVKNVPLWVIEAIKNGRRLR